MDGTGAVLADPFRHPVPYVNGGGPAVAVNVAVLLILGIVIVFLCRGGGLKVVHAAVCVVFGLYLAGTQSAGPFVRNVTTSVANLLSGLRL